MKRKVWKALALMLALALIAGLCVFANGLLGNPVSGMLATKTAKKYVAEEYAGKDFYVERVGFDFKGGYYYASVRSESSVDSHFALYLDMLGRLERDTYESAVLSGWNTAMRLETAYRALADTVTEQADFPQREGDIVFGTLELAGDREEALKLEDIADWALAMDELELDGEYDTAKLGAEAGRLVAYISGEEVTVERAAELMLEIKRLMDAGGVPFRGIDFMLQYPLPEEGRRPDGEVWVQGFLYEDIYEEGLTERIRVADAALREYYEKMDAEKEQGEARDT